MRTKWVQVGILTVTLATAGTALAKQSASGVADDQRFLAKALATNRLELALGRLALQRAVTATVREMGRKMTEKHAALGQTLSDLAVESGAASVDAPAIDAATVSRLAAAPSEQFDDLFVRTVDDIHRRELGLYESAATRATNVELRALAAGRVTALRKSLAERRQQDQDW